MRLICALVRTAVLDACASVEAVLVHAIILGIAGYSSHALGAGALAALMLASAALSLRRARRQAQSCRITITDTAVLNTEQTDRWAHTLAWSCGGALAWGVGPHLFMLAIIAIQLLWIAGARGLPIRFTARFTVAIALTTVAYQTTALVAAPLSPTQHVWTWLAAALVASACMRPLTLLSVLRHVPPANPALWLCGYEERIGMTPYGDLIALYTKDTPAPTAVYRAVTTGQWVEHTAHGEPETARRLAFHTS